MSAWKNDIKNPPWEDKNQKKYQRLMKVLTGLKFKEFELLKTPFEREWNKQMEQYTFEGARRCPPSFELVFG